MDFTHMVGLGNDDLNKATISSNVINELKEMFSNITLKYKNIKTKKVSYIFEDIEIKLQKGYWYPIYPNVPHGDTMYNDIKKYLIS